MILDLEVAPDGATIASASDDGSIRIWDLATGQLLQSIQIGGSVRNIAFLDELLDIARARLTRGFTPEECSAYQLDPCPSLEALRGE